MTSTKRSITFASGRSPPTARPSRPRTPISRTSATRAFPSCSPPGKNAECIRPLPMSAPSLFASQRNCSHPGTRRRSGAYSTRFRRSIRLLKWICPRPLLRCVVASIRSGHAGSSRSRSLALGDQGCASARSSRCSIEPGVGSPSGAHGRHLGRGRRIRKG